MDSRTRVQRALARASIDRIPRYDSPWEDTIARWKSEGLPEDADLVDYFGFDMILVGIDVSMRRPMKLISREGEYRTVQDRYGYTVRQIVGKARTVQCLEHVTTDKEKWQELKNGFRLDPADTARIDEGSYFLRLEEYPSWDEAKSRIDRIRTREKFVLYHAYGPYEGTWRHRGYENILMDIATDPDWAHEMGKAQNDLLIDCLKHAIKIGMPPDGLFLIDDLGSTRGPLFSPQSWREIHKPLYAELGAFLHDNGLSFWLHCCGDCRPLIPDLIECGLDVLQPLQVHAGMDVLDLKARYGDSLVFWGNIDARKMSGTDEEIETEIRSKIPSAKEGGGYLYHSDHSVPPEVSFDRYRWIMDLVEECGRYE